MYQNAGFILKFISQKKILLIDTSTEEFYPVHENGIYDNSLFLYPSAEGIFLYFKMCSLGMEIYFTRTLILQIKGNKKYLVFIVLTIKVR